jgi:signal transduction histidine kinase
MHTNGTEVTTLTIIITTILILVFAGSVIFILFVYQGKRFRHQKEVIEMREAFNRILLQSKLEIQEQTLDHIAKELHANFSHLVSLININLQEILPQTSPEMQESVVETKSLAKQLLSELKALSASLNTDHIMQIGFVKALDNETARVGKAKKYQIIYTKSGEEFRIKPEHGIILFRLCQEVLNNIVKYAKATTITTTLNYTETDLQLTIADDGVGFSIKLVEKERAEKESTGFLNIQKRAKLIGAKVSVETKEGEGTHVTIIVPKTENY